MSSKSIMLKRISCESLDGLAKTVIAEMIKTDADLMFQSLRKETDTEVLLLVFEKYFLRTGSYAALTIQCISTGDEQDAVIIGTGGGAGIYNVSYGANNAFAQTAEDVMKKCGFEEYGHKEQ